MRFSDFTSRTGTELSTFADFPYFFARPLPRPFVSDERIDRRRVRRRADLDQILDVKGGVGEKSNPFTVRQVELDARIVGPFHTIHAEGRTQQSAGCWEVVLGRCAQYQEECVGQEYEAPARAQKTRSFRNPQPRIGPQAGAILGDGEVKGCVGVVNRLGVAVNERKVETMLELQTPSCDELLLRVVDSHNPRAAPSEPRRNICGTAPEFNRVLSDQVIGKHAHLCLRDLPYSPARRVLGPAGFTLDRMLLGVRIPLRTIPTHMLWKVAHGKSPADATRRTSPLH